MTDRRTLAILLTSRQYEMWLFKKNYKINHGFYPTQAKIADFMHISQPAVNKMQKRINKKLIKR